MKRYTILVLTVFVFIGCSQPEKATSPVDRYVIVHGAWGGSWEFQQVDTLLTAMGHSVRRVSLTGMGERLHLSSPDVDLETHIQDAVNAILWDQLDDVVLVGHSYGGMVVTGVADRIPDRIKRVVYIDALLPLSGESAMEIIAPWIVDLIMETEQDGMSMLGADDSDEMPRGVAQPMKTFTQAIDLRNAPGSIVPARYILTVESDDGSDAFKNNADRADSLGIEVEVMKANHNPEKSAPQELVRRLVAQ